MKSLPGLLQVFVLVLLSLYLPSAIQSLRKPFMSSALSSSHTNATQPVNSSSSSTSPSSVLSSVLINLLPRATNTSSITQPFKEKKYDSIFYLKTHKTGSTTVAHHLLKYTRRFRLTSLSGPGHKYYSSPRTPNGPPLADTIVAHHMSFDRRVIDTYLKKSPQLYLTSIRLPLQRQISWFRQQNKQHEYSNQDITECDRKPNATMLQHFDNWVEKSSTAPQWLSLRESTKVKHLGRNISEILAQFDFVFIKERFRDSFECTCSQLGMKLCSKKNPLARKNIKPAGCVERQLLKYRGERLVKGSALDLMLYEEASRRLNTCMSKVTPECRCPEYLARKWIVYYNFKTKVESFQQCRIKLLCSCSCSRRLRRRLIVTVGQFGVTIKFLFFANLLWREIQRRSYVLMYSILHTFTNNTCYLLFLTSMSCWRRRSHHFESCEESNETSWSVLVSTCRRVQL